MIAGNGTRRVRGKCVKPAWPEKISRSAPLRGRGTAAIPARVRRERTRNLGKSWRKKTRGPLLANVLVTAQKLVAFDGRDDADGAFVARLGALHAGEAANADRAR